MWGLLSAGWLILSGPQLNNRKRVWSLRILGPISMCSLMLIQLEKNSLYKILTSINIHFVFGMNDR